MHVMSSWSLDFVFSQFHLIFEHQGEFCKRLIATINWEATRTGASATQQKHVMGGWRLVSFFFESHFFGVSFCVRNVHNRIESWNADLRCDDLSLVILNFLVTHSIRVPIRTPSLGWTKNVRKHQNSLKILRQLSNKDKSSVKQE